MLKVYSRNTLAGGLFAGSIMAMSPSAWSADDVMNARYVLEKMEAKQGFAYVTGIVEGLAYARFRKDTIATGSKDERGMQCVRGWFYTGKGDTTASIWATFKKYPDQGAATIIALMVKQECGE